MATPTQSGQMFNTFNYLVPTSGTTHVYASVIQASTVPFVGNFQSVKFGGTSFRPQAAWFDNSAGTGELTFTIPSIGFSLNIAAGANIAYNFPSVEGFSYEVTGAGQATIFFADFPLLPSSASVTLPNTTNVDIVSSITLQAEIVNAANSPVYSQTVSQQNNNVNGVITGTATSLSLTPPVANMKLQKLSISITGNATLAAAGVDTITSTVNGIDVAIDATYIPAAALNTGQIYTKDWDFSQASFGMAGYPLIITLATALATGQVTVNAFFTVN